MIQGNQAYVYHHSATGHTLAITDKDETIVNQYAYSPYGRLLGETETSGLEQPFKYVGKYGVQHEGDELYYMRARYYDADTGRFTMEDPIGIEGGLNVSLYGNANPVVFVDPSGLFGLVGAGIGVMLEGASQIHEGKINLPRLIVAGAVGAVTGGFGAVIRSGGLTVSQSIVASSVVGTSASVNGLVANSVIANKRISGRDVLSATTAPVVANSISSAMGQAGANDIVSDVVADLAADKITNFNRENPCP